MKTATLKIFPNAKKISKKDNSIPVYFRVIVNCIKAEGKIPDVSLTENQLRLWNHRIGCLEDSKSSINDDINLLKTNFKEIKDKSKYEGKQLSASFIRDVLLDKKSNISNISVFDYVKNYYSNTIDPSSLWTKGTKITWRKSLNHFERFIKFKKISKINFDEFNLSNGKEFLTYLTSEYPNIGEVTDKEPKIAMSMASASGIIRKIKRIFNEAILEDRLIRNPFEGIKLSSKNKKKEKLNITEVKTLYGANLIDRPALEVCRDLFLFQLFSGMSYIDMMELKPHQIVKTANCLNIYSYKRKKTGIGAQQIVNKYLQQLIDKFKQNTSVIIKGGVVPKINMQEYNDRLKLLVDLYSLSIPNLSSHYGRHCYRQFLTEAKVTDAGAIYTFMGWSREKFMDSIYSNITEEQLLDASKLFELYLHNHLDSNVIKQI